MRGAAFIYVEHVGAVMHTDLCNLNKCWGMLWQPCMLLLICFYSLEIINIFYNSTKKKKNNTKKQRNQTVITYQEMESVAMSRCMKIAIELSTWGKSF